ncbi:MAG: hypothetical protein JW990_05350 [Thermoleophilia bacterium]|nr:hypothetical protein [Thermoleophilia bacterium]
MGDYEDLSADAEFSQALGRMTLAASRLESDMRTFLALSGFPPGDRATFGSLIGQLKKRKLISVNGELVLGGLKTQRNYLTHSLYDLFAARIDERLMCREELDDIGLLAERAWILEQNLNSLAETAERRIVELQHGQPGDGLLLKP